MIIDTYSSRNSAPCSKLLHDQINEACRLQIANIAKDFFTMNQAEGYGEEHFWNYIQEWLKDEHAKDSLHNEHAHRVFGGYSAPSYEVTEYLKSLKDINHTLDTIELIFRLLPHAEDELVNAGYRIYYKAKAAVEHLNKRFTQHCIGYKFEGNIIIKIDNELMYASVTKEMFVLLEQQVFGNVNEEYLQAHRQFRSGNHKDCIVNCAKAFESTLKIICDQKQYAYQQNDTAARLLNVLYVNNFIPSYLQVGMSGLRSMLEAISVVRNNTSAHGVGSAQINIGENFASYALHVTGCNIKFLVSLL